MPVGCSTRWPQYGEAIELAHRHGFTDDELKITMSLSSALVLSGDHVAALSSLDAVAPLVDGRCWAGC